MGKWPRDMHDIFPQRWCLNLPEVVNSDIKVSKTLCYLFLSLASFRLHNIKYFNTSLARMVSSITHRHTDIHKHSDTHKLRHAYTHTCSAGGAECYSIRAHMRTHTTTQQHNWLMLLLLLRKKPGGAGSCVRTNKFLALYIWILSTYIWILAPCIWILAPKLEIESFRRVWPGEGGLFVPPLHPGGLGIGVGKKYSANPSNPRGGLFNVLLTPMGGGQRCGADLCRGKKSPRDPATYILASHSRPRI